MKFRSIANPRGFLSDYWLGTVFAKKGARLGHKVTPAQARKLLWRLEQIHQKMEGKDPDLSRFRESFARPLLRDLFGFEIRENPQEPRLRPLSGDGDSSAPILSCLLMIPERDAVPGPAQRKLLEKGLAELHLNYGFLLSPDSFRIIRARGIPPKGAYLEFKIDEAIESGDVDSFLAIIRLLHAGNFLPDTEGKRPIERIEEESRAQAQKVSEDLKRAVFESAESLIRAFLADSWERRGETFPPGQKRLYEFRDAAFLCLYRLLFILYAEARDEKLQTHPVYHPYYSLETLIDQILREGPEEQAKNHYGYWQRVLSLFRIYDQGLPASEKFVNIPPRGGYLFSETTGPGELIASVLLDDMSIAHLLLSLATARPRRGIGIERIHFQELGIEQLGSVYEGLLEYEPRIADKTMVEFKVQGKLFVLEPSELKRLCEEKNLVVKGDAEIIRGTEALELHPEAGEEDEEEMAVEGEEVLEGEEEKGLKKGATARLLRRFESGDFYFVTGSARKSTGTFYTPTEIVDYLVLHSLGPLVEGKKAEEIESLRVIDCACGSAHFLIGATRFLGQALHTAYKKELNSRPPEAFLHGRDSVAELREEWELKGEDWCKRRIIERCLFGVDLNPTAVELARVALWVESLCGDRPLSFFNHHIRCGNSLLDTWFKRLWEPPLPSLEKKKDKQILLHQQIAERIEEKLKKSAALRLQIDVPYAEKDKIETVEEIKHKERLLKDAESVLPETPLLFDLRSASAFIPEIWKDWWELLEAAEREELGKVAVSKPWWEEFQKIREREKFFHWELEFPEVFLDETPGFDVVIGNPPWDKILPNRHEFYGRYDILIRAFKGGELDQRIKELIEAMPFLAAEFQAYSERINTTARILKSGGDYHFNEWQLEAGTTGGHQDAFKYFVERAYQILKSGGLCGYLVPSALYNNEGCTGLRHLLLDRCRVERFFAFENRRKIFPIHSSYKFVCLVYQKEEEENKEQEFQAAFMRHDVGELEKGPPPGVQVLIRRAELEFLSPGTLAFLEYRSERDREIVLKMYKNRPLLGDRGPGTWNAKFYTEFNMTNDKDLWTDPKTGKLWTPKQICGLNWPEDMSIPFSEVRAAMAEKGFWPLYEGKHIEQFLIDIKPIERWLSLEACKQKYGKPPVSEPKVVFRDIASNTNERTCLSAVLPQNSCAGNTLAVLGDLPIENDKAVTLMNSFCFDFVTRLKTAGTHLNWTYISRVVVPRFEELKKVKDTESRRIEDMGEVQAMADHNASWPKLWISNKTVAQAYGMRANELENILSTFPVFARKRPEFFAYLKGKVEEWKAES